MSGTMIEGHPGPAPSTTRERVVDDASVRQAALVAGWAILAMAVLSAFGIFCVVDGLVTRGEAATTVEDIAASTGLFRWGTASLYAVVVLDVVVVVPQVGVGVGEVPVGVLVCVRGGRHRGAPI